MSIFSDIAETGLSALATYAPTLATMIGGPLAGTAVSALESILGIAPTGDSQKALAAVANATPDQILALKAEDNRHFEALQKAGIDLETLAGADRKSARDREIAVRDWVPACLAILVTVGFFGLLGYLVGHEAPAGSRDILNIMLGSLGTGWVQMLSYYYGASATGKPPSLSVPQK